MFNNFRGKVMSAKISFRKTLSARLLFFLSFVTLNANCLAQDTAYTKNPFSAGSIELGASGSIGSYTSSVSYSAYGYGNQFSGAEEYSTNYFSLSLLPAIYISDGFAVEPETDFFFLKDHTPDLSVLLNLSYTYFPGKGKACPFFRIGYGITNSLKIPVNSNTLQKASNELDIKVLNFGTGLKIPFGNVIAFRSELNYRIYSSDKDENQYGYSSKSKTNNKFLSVLLGFSVLL